MKTLFLGVFNDRSTNTSQARGLERAGATVLRFDYRKLAGELGRERRDRRIIEECGSQDVDWVLFSKCNDVDIEVVEACNERAKTLLWYMDPVDANFAPELVRKIETCSITCCSSTSSYMLARKIGQNVHFLHEGFDPRIDWPVPSEPEHDASMIGSLKGKRRLYHSQIGFHVFTSAYGFEHALAVAKSRISLNFTQGGTSDRFYKILAAKGFMLTEPWPGMEEDFSSGVHLDTFSDPAELREKIGFYLGKERLRLRIAQAGHEKVQKFSRDLFAARMLDLMRQTA